tara:strand:- start:37 stop:786 length:750 start_codon:yes stop_codon:yes gene_type:complete
MEIIILIIAAFLTSTISAIIGMGGGIILLGIMAIIIPEGYLVIALHGIIQLISNSTRTYIFRDYLNKQLIKEFFYGAIIGLCAASIIILSLIHLYNVTSANEIKVDYLKPLVGVFIIWYLFFKRKKNIKKNKAFYSVGGISGLSTVFIGATGPLIAPFFLNKSFVKEEIIANKAACQMISHLGKIPLFIYFFNVNYIEQYNILIPLILAVFIGTNFGKKILGFIPEKTFIKLFRFALLVIALRLIFYNF